MQALCQLAQQPAYLFASPANYLCTILREALRVRLRTRTTSMLRTMYYNTTIILISIVYAAAMHQKTVSLPAFQALTTQAQQHTHNAHNYAALTTPDVKPLADCVLHARRPPTTSPRFARDAPSPLRNRGTPRVCLARVTPPAVLLAARHPRRVRAAAADLSLGTATSFGSRSSSLPADIAMLVRLLMNARSPFPDDGGYFSIISRLHNASVLLGNSVIGFFFSPQVFP